jgi:signal transduction histidine kinase
VGLIQKIVDEQHSISESRCPIQIESEEELDGAVGDEALIRHILGNLISNAVKYSPTGERVTVRIERKGVSAICSIADRGIGIPEKDQEHLFESFNRASNVGDVPGTGLGLVIVKRCVEFHGGSITLVSAAGQGTTFTVVLPVYGTNADDLSSLTLGEHI